MEDVSLSLSLFLPPYYSAFQINKAFWGKKKRGEDKEEREDGKRVTHTMLHHTSSSVSHQKSQEVLSPLLSPQHLSIVDRILHLPGTALARPFPLPMSKCTLRNPCPSLKDKGSWCKLEEGYQDLSGPV